MNEMEDFFQKKCMEMLIFQLFLPEFDDLCFCPKIFARKPWGTTCSGSYRVRSSEAFCRRLGDNFPSPQNDTIQGKFKMNQHDLSDFDFEVCSSSKWSCF